MDVFLNGQCIACHAVAGPRDANGSPPPRTAAPNLTHFAEPRVLRGLHGCDNDDPRQLDDSGCDDPAAVKPGS